MFADEILAARSQIQGVSPDAWFDRLQAEHDQLQAELRWLHETDLRRGLELAGVLWPYWVARGRLVEGRGWLDEFLAHTAAEPRTAHRAEALHGAGILAFLQGEGERARRLLNETLLAACELGDGALEADALIGLARVAMIDREPLTMERRARESAEVARAVSDERRFATALHHVAEALRRQGRDREALPIYRDAIERHRALGDRRSVALELHNLGRAARRTDGAQVAAERFRESLEIAAELNHERLVGYCLLGLANLAAEEGNSIRAVRLIAASDSLFAAIGAERDPEYSDEREHVLSGAESALGDVRSAGEYEAGSALGVEQSVREALLTA